MFDAPSHWLTTTQLKGLIDAPAPQEQKGTYRLLNRTTNPKASGFWILNRPAISTLTDIMARGDTGTAFYTVLEPESQSWTYPKAALPYKRETRVSTRYRSYDSRVSTFQTSSLIRSGSWAKSCRFGDRGNALVPGDGP